MAKLINAKCPNCGATLELPENLDRAFCMHCGGKVIIAKDVHYHGGKTAIACPECEGKGYEPCYGDRIEVEPPFEPGKVPLTKWTYSYYKSPCDGTGKCVVKETAVKGKDGEPYKPSVFCMNGKCKTCSGTGFICRVCQGTKICFVCEGSGRCTYCDGTGKRKCRACNGTGFKVYESG